MEKLPKFKLKLFDDAEIKSSEIKKAILFFYPKAMTGGCTIEFVIFNQTLTNSKNWVLKS